MATTAIVITTKVLIPNFNLYSSCAFHRVPVVADPIYFAWHWILVTRAPVAAVSSLWSPLVPATTFAEVPD